MALSIIIAPAADGWAVTSQDLGLDLVFSSGAQAEAHGRETAGRLARAGYAVELDIILRDGSLAATIPYAPAMAA
jgi:hypothetical protein